MYDNPGDWEKGLSLKESILERGCKEYEDLVTLRNERFQDDLLHWNIGWDASQRRYQRGAKRNTGDEHWVKIGCFALKEIDGALHCIPRHQIHFLDLGCCPGGFSQYVLSQNRRAQGTGISLDPEYGGRGLAIHHPQRRRYEMHWADLTRLAVCSPRPAPAGAVALSPTPFTTTRFQLVILDAVRRVPTDQESTSAHPWDMDRLLIAQLIIALEYIDRGGTLLIKFDHLESVTTAQLIYMLDKFSKELVVFKPQLYATRDRFYAVATGVGQGREGMKRKSLLENLREVWWKLTYGDDPRSEGRRLKEEDLNFIVNFETLKDSYMERLIELGRGAWQVQRCALQNAYKKIRRKAVTHQYDSADDASES